MKIYIRQYRKLKNMTLEELSRASQISTTHISDIENGKNCPTLITLCKIAKALNVSAKDLFDCDDEDCSGNSEKDCNEKDVQK